MSGHATPNVTIRPEDFVTPAAVDVIRRRSSVIGGIAAVAATAGAFFSPDQFFRAYLVGFMFWLGITLGCLALLMLQYLSGGVWGLIIRRQLQAASKNISLMIVFFLPLLFGMGWLYPWAQPETVAHDPLLQHRAPVFSPGAFTLRAVLYFAAWWVLGYMLTRLSEQRDRSPGDDLAWRRRLQVFAAPGLVVYGFTITFASIDWVMSLDPLWFSTMFGVLFIGGQALSGMAFAIAMTVLLSHYPPMSRILKPGYFVDLGKLLLAFVMLWAYFSFSQYLIIWSGNLPEETPWYLARTRGGWEYVAVALIVFHFLVPFVLLLSRDLKKRTRMLATVASSLLVMRVVDLFWLIQPNFVAHGAAPHFNLSWLHFAVPTAMGGIWMALFLTQLRSRPLLPLQDPLLREILAEHQHQGHHAV